MKKILSLLLVLSLVFTLAACNSSGGNSSSEQASGVQAESSGRTPAVQDAATNESAVVDEVATENSGEETQNDDDGERILIAYFTRVGNTDFDANVDATTSASIQVVDGDYVGNTEVIARLIQENVGGDLLLIETVEKYPSDYNEVIDFAQSELGGGVRPVLRTQVENMADYDVVFIGFPNWWYDMPMAVYSFLEEYDFDGKTVIPFCTHGGSGFSGAIGDMERILTGATLLEGYHTNGNNVTGAQSAVSDWLGRLELAE